ncbi:putative GTPase activating protein for Arf-domain-containing protein [Schizothecium vesticola]|uniref:GTPase activating protein for Arf-domain-containing protein n=1 Tax=Schizothecium vesticola TaxID=314040 RepID=A0AA40F776_9PEZI|nr:putative GTPase activating protein for Arf-domain-containing protein [Schizothecium vesticola]
MTGVLSKRQQARNEKVLQELVQTVPGNNFCADCQTRNPSWASWSLGIFLCMRCAAIHRKLGTHISKVKSLSMDSWSNEQVENMRKVGNASSNKTYNPQNKKVQLPVDADEIDGAMERYIRQKYMNRTFNTGKRHNTGSTESDETPPPLPPKTPSRFGFRSASSIFPLGSKAKAAQQPPPSPRELPPDPSQRWNKASQVFGASVGGNDDAGDPQATERKLAKLRDMGFMDEQRNQLVLKGVSGNMEKTIEALIRLGEGGGGISPGIVPVRQSSMPVNRSLTHAASTTSMRDSARARPLSPATNNPFHMLDNPPTPQPLSSQSTGTLQNRNPYLAPNNNPFGAPSQQVADIAQAYQGLSLAPPSQPLFPNHTGGLAAQQVAPQPDLPPAQPVEAYNPFMNQPPQQHQQPLTVNTAPFPGGFASNPFTRSPTRIQSPPLTQIPEQSQQNFYAAAQQPQVQVAQTTNPFFTQTPTMPQQYQQQPGQMMQQQTAQMMQQQPTQMMQQQPSPFQPQMTGYYPQQQQQVAYQPPRPDKASIMALYNYPQLAPTQFQSGQAGEHGQPEQQQQQAQMPTPLSAGSNNPFMNAGRTAMPAQQQNLIDAAFAPAVSKPYNTSRESMMAGGLEWTNGRHSPDAFASLSANTR